MYITTIGIDLAKRVFAIHGVDHRGITVVRKTLRREQMVPFFMRLQPCVVAMEACGSAHYWARKLAILALHRIRDGFIKAHTAQANQLRGLLAEFGLIIPQGMAKLMTEVKCMIADDSNELPSLMHDLAQRLLSYLLALDRQVQEIDNQVRQLSRQGQRCRA